MKTQVDKSISLEVSDDTPIENVKAKIHEREAIPPDQQQLICGSKLLEDGRFICCYNVQNESTLELFVRPKQGMWSFSGMQDATSSEEVRRELNHVRQEFARERQSLIQQLTEKENYFQVAKQELEQSAR